VGLSNGISPIAVSISGYIYSSLASLPAIKTFLSDRVEKRSKEAGDCIV